MSDDDDDPSERDCFGPPDEPCECYCLHCGRTFMSDQMWFQSVVGARDGFDGFWMCPTPNCDGAGFTFDIFPTDPAHPANDGWHDAGDEEAPWDDEPEQEFGDEGQEHAPDESRSEEWDPEESDYKAMQEADADIEGEEWKYGLRPGEQFPEPEWADEARREWEREQRKYEEPDMRPRVVDWSDREEGRRPHRDGPFPGDGQSFSEDDIPF